MVAERGRCDGRWALRGWMFLREGEIPGVWRGPEVRGLPLYIVPNDYGRTVGGLGKFSLWKVLFHRRRASRFPFFGRGEQNLLPELRHIAHLQGRRGRRLHRRDHREPGPA